MLINCPRCGFQQPQDKYCAQCGVDMENFKPASPSTFKKIFGNPLVQLSLLVVIAGGVSISLFQQSRRDVASQRVLTPSSLQVTSGVATTVTAASVSSESADIASSESQAVAPESESLIAAQEGEAPVGQEIATTAETENSNNKANTAAAKPGAPKLVVYYAEVLRPELQRIFEASQNTGQFMSFGDYAAGIIPQVERKVVPSNLNIKVLHREERVLDTPAPLRWFYGRGEAGLGIFIEPTELDANNFRGNIEIRRNWIELNASQAQELVRKAFPAIFEVAQGTGFFVSGVIPRKTPLDNDNEFTSIDVYRILRSPAFQKGDSEFVIFIEFDKSN